MGDSQENSWLQVTRKKTKPWVVWVLKFWLSSYFSRREGGAWSSHWIMLRKIIESKTEQKSLLLVINGWVLRGCEKFVNMTEPSPKSQESCSNSLGLLLSVISLTSQHDRNKLGCLKSSTSFVICHRSLKINLVIGSPFDQWVKNPSPLHFQVSKFVSLHVF